MTVLFTAEHPIWAAVRALWNYCNEHQRDCLIQGSDLDYIDTKTAWYDLPFESKIAIIEWLVEKKNADKSNRD